jgi:hypothetical protein
MRLRTVLFAGLVNTADKFFAHSLRRSKQASNKNSDNEREYATQAKHVKDHSSGCHVVTPRWLTWDVLASDMCHARIKTNFFG